MLQVILPESLVLGSILMNIGSVTIGLVIAPLSIVDVSIGMHEFTLAVSLVIFPLTDILGAIRPSLRSVTMPLAAFPVTVVNCSGLEDMPHLSVGFGAMLGFLVFSEGKVLVRAYLFALHEGDSPPGNDSPSQGLHLRDVIDVRLQEIINFITAHVIPKRSRSVKRFERNLRINITVITVTPLNRARYIKC
jgi:hypothetical protein